MVMVRMRPIAKFNVLALCGLLAIGTYLTAGLSGCRRAGTSQTAAQTKQYPVRGKIISVDTGSGHIMLAHEAIPGFMEAMTMSYRLEDPSIASELHAGDRITATLVVDQDSAGPINPRLKNIVVVAQARPDYKPKVQYHVPAVGETVPNFSMLNQSDKKISLAQFRGKVVLMTFIYTRCPLADFCPRMSRNFADMDKALAVDPGLYAKTHLLSVSFDPKYDTPKVLRSYGGSYTGKFVNEKFDHWDFAAPSEADLPNVEHFFSVGVTPGEGNAPLQHSLATVVIGKDGKVVAFYPGNEWTVADAMNDVKKAAA